MNRIGDARYGETIGKALSLYPTPLRERLAGTHFLTDTDPVFAGLHCYGDTTDGRSYKETAHAVYPFHQEHRPRCHRTPTVVLPVRPSLCTVVHELAHVLDWHLGFDHVAKPVTEYAKTNRSEAFAEAVTSWIFYGYGEEPSSATKSYLDRVMAP